MWKESRFSKIYEKGKIEFATYRRTTEKLPKWRASSFCQTYPRAFPRWFRLSRRQRGNPFRRQFSDISYRIRDSTRYSKCCRDYPSCWTPKLRTASFSSYSELNNLPREEQKKESLDLTMSRTSPATFISLAKPLCRARKGSDLNSLN